ncbi:MAG: hypothetical protein AB1457_17610 [Chloroflexota bacterium]|nr:MAG: hypothetical protein KatS3mg047_0049 [Bellilinea sp.]
MNNNAFSQPHSERYRIIIKGAMDEEFLRDYCAPGFTLTYSTGRTTLSNIRTDQAGMVGLIRRLHNLGVTVLIVELQSDMEDTQ